MYAMTTSDGAVLIADTIDDLGAAIAQLETEDVAVQFHETSLTFEDLLDGVGDAFTAQQRAEVSASIEKERVRLATL